MVSFIRKALFSLFYPRTCAMCGNYIGESSGEDARTLRHVLCDACIKALPRTEQAVLRQNETEEVVGLDHAAAFLFFEKDHPVQQLIHRMKYADQPEIGFLLGRQAAMEFIDADFFDEPEEIDLIVPVPLHPKRLRERGYNQSEYIARGISDITGIPVDTMHVIRERYTSQQALQTGEDRKANVKDAFSVLHPEELKGRHILLVDDLVTTGETVKACLKAMKRIRGASFSVFALCKAR